MMSNKGDKSSSFPKNCCNTAQLLCRNRGILNMVPSIVFHF